MALIVEDGTGKADADSYNSITELDAYHTSMNNATWTGADPIKEAAARRATMFIDSRYGALVGGFRKILNQALVLPKIFWYDRDGVLLNSETIPTLWKRAHAELSLRALVNGELAPDIEREQESVTVGPIEVVYASGASLSTRYAWIDDILAPLLPAPGRLVRR